MSVVSTKWLPGFHSASFYTTFYTPNPSTYPNPRAVILFLHGFIEHVGRYAPIFPLWGERGFAVVAYDQWGFGKTALDPENGGKGGFSYGKTSAEMQRKDAEDMLDMIGREYKGVDVFLMGHSMGGCEALSLACNSPHASKLAGILATSPLIRQTTPAPKWQRLLGSGVSKLLPWTKVPASINPAELSRDKLVGEAYMSDPLVVHHGTVRGVGTMLDAGDALIATDYKKWPVNLPVLIIHGADDKITSHDASKELIGRLPAKDKTFLSYEGGFHELHNEPEGMRERLVKDCIDWVEKHLQREGVSPPEAQQPDAKF